MPAKRKGNRKRQSDATDEISNDGWKEEKTQLNIESKKRKSDYETTEKEKSFTSTLVVPTSCVNQPTETEIKQDEQDHLRQDEITKRSGPHTLTELEKVIPVVLLEDITLKNNDSTYKQTVEEGEEIKVKTDGVEVEVPMSEIAMVSEVNTQGTSQSDVDHTNKDIPIHMVECPNEKNLLSMVEDDNKQIPNTIISCHQNICVDKQMDVAEDDDIIEPDKAEKAQDENPVVVPKKIDNQITDSVNQEQDNPIEFQAESMSALEKTENIVKSDDIPADKNFIDKENETSNHKIITANITNENLINNEVEKVVVNNQDHIFESEGKATVQPSDSRQAQNDSVEKDLEPDLPELNESIKDEKKQEVLTDSQLCALDWMSQFPEEEGNSPIENPDQIPMRPRESGDSDQPIEDGSTIIRGFIKELSNLNKMILKTKREIENARRQRKTCTK